MKVTSSQVKLAFQILKNEGISGNEFCRMCGVDGANQTYWRKHGVSGAVAALLKQQFSDKEWKLITKQKKGDGDA